MLTLMITRELAAPEEDEFGPVPEPGGGGCAPGPEPTDATDGGDCRAEKAAQLCGIPEAFAAASRNARRVPLAEVSGAPKNPPRLALTRFAVDTPSTRTETPTVVVDDSPLVVQGELAERDLET